MCLFVCVVLCVRSLHVYKCVCEMFFVCQCTTVKKKSVVLFQNTVSEELYEKTKLGDSNSNYSMTLPSEHARKNNRAVKNKTGVMGPVLSNTHP